LKRKPSDRIGAKGIEEIKFHPWFKDFDWTKLYFKKIKATFIPRKGDNFNSKNANAKEPITENYEFILDMLNKSKEFNGYYYNRFDLRHSKVILHSGIQFTNPHEIKLTTVNIKEKSSFKKINSCSLRKNVNLGQDIDIEDQKGCDISSLYLNKNSYKMNMSNFIRENINEEESKISLDMFDNSYVDIKRISEG
jgi:hypothetical protein